MNLFINAVERLTQHFSHATMCYNIIFPFTMTKTLYNNVIFVIMKIIRRLVIISLELTLTSR